MSTPSLCGSFIGSKKALLAFTWSITTLLTIFAFFMAILLVIQINSHYRYLERINSDDNYQNRRMQDEGEQHSGDKGEDDPNWYPYLAGTSSGSMTFVALWTMLLATGLSLYGTTAIVGLTSLRGVYIAPCFPHRNQLKIGVFGGAVVVFSNLLLLNAVIFGEFKVEDYREKKEGEEVVPYAVERIANVLGATCMILSVVYACFSVLFFCAYASDSPPSSSSDDHDSRTQPLTADHRHQQFITIEGTVT